MLLSEKVGGKVAVASLPSNSPTVTGASSSAVLKLSIEEAKAIRDVPDPSEATFELQSVVSMSDPESSAVEAMAAEANVPFTASAANEEVAGNGLPSEIVVADMAGPDVAETATKAVATESVSESEAIREVPESEQDPML